MANLFLHLGPPKTATSSLQIFFQDLKHHKIKYYGAFQPRNKKNNEFIQKLVSDVKTQNLRYQDFILNVIIEDLIKNINVLISEEMIISVDENKSLKTNIHFLSNYFSKLNDVRIIYTIRKPSDIIPSYFQQIFTSLNKKYQNDFKHFVLSNYCEIFKFKLVVDALNSHNNFSVILIDYNKLISGYYSLNKIINNLEEHNIIKVNLEKANISKSKNGQRYSKEMTLKQKISKIIHKIPFSKSLKGLGYSKILIENIPNIRIRKERKIETSSDLIELIHYDKIYYSLIEDLH